MSEHVFLYKDNSEDRDCVKYIDAKPMRFECDHYFGGIIPCGACFSGCPEFENGTIIYDDIVTVLTREEFSQLLQFNKAIHELGYGIKRDDERYQRGVELCNSIQPVYDKLLSNENVELFETIKKEEVEYLKEEYNLTEEDIANIFDNYGQDYRDRSVVGYVFDSVEDAAREEAFELGYVKEDNDRYFDYEKFGEDLMEGEQYLELEGGRVATLSY